MATFGQVDSNTLIGGVRFGAILTSSTIQGGAFGTKTSGSSITTDSEGGGGGSGEDGQLIQKQLGAGTGAPKGFYQWLPDDYSITGSQTYPFILFLGGFGTRGNGTSELSRVLTEGNAIPDRLRDGTWDGKQGSEKFIVLMPQQSDNTQWLGTGGTSDITEFKDWAKTYYRIDTTRMYLTGFSMGGKGTYEGGNVDNDPNEWAALAPVCTANSTFQMGQGCGSKNIPMYCYYGDSDNSDNEPTPYNGYLSTVTTADHNVQIMTGQGHNPANAYSPTFYSPNLYEKLLTQTL